MQDKRKQQEHVKKLFWRQLRTPLADHADTLEAYEEWASGVGEATALPSDVQAEYKKAVKLVDARLPYEQSVSRAIAVVPRFDGDSLCREPSVSLQCMGHQDRLCAAYRGAVVHSFGSSKGFRPA